MDVLLQGCAQARLECHPAARTAPSGPSTTCSRSRRPGPSSGISWSRRPAGGTGPAVARVVGGTASGNRAFQLLRPAGVAAVMPCWGVLQARVVQLRHRAGLGAAWHQPSGAPRQRPPAGNVMARCCSDSAALARPPDPPQPVQLRRQRPGAVLQVLQVAMAVERPPMDAARPAAGVAGLRGARTGIVGPRPAAASVGLVEPRSGLKADLPGPAGHWRSPPWPGCQAPTNPPSRRARPSRSRIALIHRTPRRSGLPGTVWVPSAARRRNGQRTLDRGTLDRPVMSCQQGSG
jgi:hypothetical protein